MKLFPKSAGVPASRWLIAAAFAASLTACGGTTGPKKPVNDYATLLKNAEADVSASRIEQALVAFNQAAQADPTRKEPWVRSAQLQFDAGNYGRAIVASEEVLKRDPNDATADSILTVSGLRVAAKSLQRLQGNGAISSESAQKEAKDLANALKSTMGASVFAEQRPAGARPGVRRSSGGARPAGTAPTTPPPTTNSANPFD